MRFASNPFGWSPRGIRHWLSTWGFFSTWGTEITSSKNAIISLDGRPLRVYRQFCKLGPFVWERGAYAVIAYSTSDDEDAWAKRGALRDIVVAVPVRKRDLRTR